MSYNNGPKIVTNGLVLYLDAANNRSYPGSGTVWTDITKNGNNGNLINGPTYTSSFGGGIVFDGTDDFVSGSIASSTFSGPHSIGCWFYRTVVKQWSALFSNNTGTISSTILTFIDSTNKIGTNNAGVSATDISIDLGADHLNKWTYCMITYAGVSSGNAINVYAFKERTFLSSAGSLYWNMTTNGAYYVGRHYAAASQIHQGFIPSVQVYNRVLSVSEFRQNYHASKGRFGL